MVLVPSRVAAVGTGREHSLDRCFARARCHACCVAPHPQLPPVRGYVTSQATFSGEPVDGGSDASDASEDEGAAAGVTDESKAPAAAPAAAPHDDLARSAAAHTYDVGYKKWENFDEVGVLWRVVALQGGARVWHEALLDTATSRSRLGSPGHGGGGGSRARSQEAAGSGQASGGEEERRQEEARQRWQCEEAHACVHRWPGRQRAGGAHEL